MNKALAIFFAILLAMLSIGSVIAIPSPGSGAAHQTSGLVDGKHTQANAAGVFLSVKSVESDKSCALKKIPAAASCEHTLADVRKNKLSPDERKTLRRQIRDVEQEFDAAKQ